MDFYGFDEEKAKRAVEKYREWFRPKGIYQNAIYPGIEEMLSRLKAGGHGRQSKSEKAAEYSPSCGKNSLVLFLFFHCLSSHQKPPQFLYRLYHIIRTGSFQFPLFEEVLSRLKVGGKVLAVASSKPQIFVEQVLRHFGIYDYFTVIVGSPNQTINIYIPYTFSVNSPFYNLAAHYPFCRPLF